MKTFAQFQEETKVLLGKPKSHSEKVTKKLNKFSATFDLNKSPKFGLKILGQEIPPKNIEVKRSLTPSTAIDRALEKYKGGKKVNESVTSLSLKGGSKLIPALMTGIGAAGTIMQARKKRKIGSMEKRLYDREMNVRDNDMIRARRGEADKQNKLIDKYEKKHKSQKEKNIRKNVMKGLKGGEVIQDEFSAPTNSVGGGQIAGTVEAGDDPPVKKKKRYIYGGTGSRKRWMA